MEKFIKVLLFCLLPFALKAQVNGTIQLTVGTGVVRGSFGASGLDSLMVLQKNSLADGDYTRYNAATFKFIPRTPAQVRSDIGAGTGSGTVINVSGTTNRITVTNPTTTPVIDISSAYVGQNTITTLGTIGTGVWNAGSVTTTNIIQGGRVTATSANSTTGIEVDNTGTGNSIFIANRANNTSGYALNWYQNGIGSGGMWSTGVQAGTSKFSIKNQTVGHGLPNTGTTALEIDTLNAVTLAGTIAASNLVLGSTFTTSGAFPVIQRYTASTDVTFPTSGTLATTAGLWTSNTTQTGLTGDKTTTGTITAGSLVSNGSLSATGATDLHDVVGLSTGKKLYWNTSSSAYINSTGTNVMTLGVNNADIISLSTTGLAVTGGPLTGTSASFSTTLSVTGHTTFEGITSTGATGTGKLVYSISPVLTGTVSANNISAIGNIKEVAGNSFLLENTTQNSTAQIWNSGGTGASAISMDFPLDISTSTAGQIKFPATQNASSNVNTLDDYEEGAWTPAASFAGGNGDLSYSIQAGQYTKIGRQVTCVAYLLFSETTASGNLSISGLPFTSSSITNLLGGFGIFTDNLALIVGAPVGFINTSSTTIPLSYTGTGASTTISNTNTGANALFRMSFTYFTD